MTGGPTQTNPVIVPSGHTPLTVEVTPRTMRMVYVSFDELDTISSLGSSLNLSFVGISFGALLGFAITIATVDIAGPKTWAAFVALTAVAFVFSIFFGARAYNDHSAAKQRISELKGKP